MNFQNDGMVFSEDVAMADKSAASCVEAISDATEEDVSQSERWDNQAVIASVTLSEMPALRHALPDPSETLAENVSSTTMPPQRWRVFVVDSNDGMPVQPWVSSNGSSLPPTIPLGDADFPRKELFRASKPRCITDAYFWLAFVLQDVNFKGRLFETLWSPLHIASTEYTTKNKLPAIHFHLPDAVRAKWSWLESMLAQLRDLLVKMIEIFPLTIEFPPRPLDFRMLDKARWAFVLQMAFIFCLGSMHPSLVNPDNVTRSVWTHVPDETQLALQSSWMFDKISLIPRVGAFIDTSETWQWLEKFNAFSAVRGLPLWLHYSMRPEDRPAHPAFERHAPSEEQIARALENPDTCCCMPLPKQTFQMIWEDQYMWSLRRVVGKKKIKEAWSQYHPTQRWYDQLSRQWDLWEGFNPNVQGGNENDDNDYDYDTGKQSRAFDSRGSKFGTGQTRITDTLPGNDLIDSAGEVGLPVTHEHIGTANEVGLPIIGNLLVRIETEARHPSAGVLLTRHTAVLASLVIQVLPAEHISEIALLAAILHLIVYSPLA
ncbi:uncharacterized protein PHACADRAFT_189345 [Phanerochaete carnosa HHB-10118-sp]|uniref:Uncharacterized protein n=1 Tax=Phanerochaete carnosa (strain HHB-10118-sp) TaxID=650164 RepID=K5WLA3_PHACS|nr:uncharacterized protein PHACADRAFT_189345 [Phanerochaete carnosa HHB-10118-sp]EKM60210.1 hypothetical protein PHACADRAFT_189345 [Phanerochaete carnosa HHB-10118-sp]